mmetsp:Transcript_36859/g.105913  ORF Transcript_36859/g.105913 Transcript_36859/m.105913 type:complete len:681 (-) Transcript_36859:157-2199(-)
MAASLRLRRLLSCGLEAPKAADPASEDGLAGEMLAPTMSRRCSRPFLPSLLLHKLSGSGKGVPEPQILEAVKPSLGEATPSGSQRHCAPGASKVWRLRCIFADGLEHEGGLECLPSMSLALGEGSTCLGRQHQPEFFHEALRQRRGNVSFVSRTHVECITHLAMDLVLVRNLSSNPLFADEELLGEGDWRVLPAGSVLSFGRPQDGHIVFFLKLALCAECGEGEDDMALPPKRLSECTESTKQASTLARSPECAGETLHERWSTDKRSSSFSNSSHCSSSTLSIPWAKVTSASVPLRGSGSAEWPHWEEEISADELSNKQERTTCKSFSWSTASSSTARPGLVESLMWPLLSESTTDVGDETPGRASTVPRESPLRAPKQSPLQARLGEPLAAAVEGFRTLESCRRLSELEASMSPLDLEGLLEELGISKADTERIRRMGSRYEEFAEQYVSIGPGWQIAECNKALGMEFGFDVSDGLLKLTYRVDFRGIADVPAAVARATAGLAELDLHRHFRSEVDTTAPICTGAAANECLWRERTHGKNLGGRGEAMVACEVTDALDEAEACIFINVRAQDAGLAEGSKFLPLDRITIMTFRVSPLKDCENNGYRIVCCQSVRPPLELYRFLESLPTNSLAAAIRGQVNELVPRLRTFLHDMPVLESRMRDGPRSDMYRRIKERMQG